jgi:hypothetical protein
MDNIPLNLEMPMPHGLGRRHAPDARDQRHLMATFVPVAVVPSLPPFRYWATGPTLDQGNTPMCVEYTWEGLILASPIRNKKPPARGTIYKRAQQIDEWTGEDYDGTSVRAGAKVLQELGFISQYIWAFDAATVARFILAHGPVAMGTNWYWDMFQPDKHGVVRPRNGIAGGHAYLCNGYNEKQGRFRCLNSWGTNWAQRGRFWILGEDMDRLIMEQGEACAPTEILIA